MAEPERIVFDIEADSAGAAAAKFDGLSTALQKTSQHGTELRGHVHGLGEDMLESGESAGFFSKHLAAANENAEVFREHGREAKAVIGELGRAFVTLNPAIAEYSEVLRTGIGVTHGLMELFEGPAGLAIAAVTAGFAALGVVWSENQKHAKELREQTEKLNKELEKQASWQWQLQNINKTQQDKAFWDRLALGAGTENEYASVVNSLARKIKADEDVEENQKKLEFYMKEARIARELRKQELLDDAEGSGNRSDAANAAQSRGGAAQKNAGELSDFFSDSSDAQLAQKKIMDERLQEEAKKNADIDVQIAQWAADQKEKIRLEDQAADRLATQEHAKELAKKRQEEEKAAKDEQMMQQKLIDFARIGVQTGVASLQSLAKGHKVTMGQIIEQIGDQLVAMGVSNEMEGIGRVVKSYYTDGTGYQLMAIGGIEIAAGIGMGAAGARAPGGSSAGGGGGGALPSTTAASPARDTYTAPGTGGGPVTINVNTPSVVLPSAEEGLVIRKGLERAHNVYGSWGGMAGRV